MTIHSFTILLIFASIALNVLNAGTICSADELPRMTHGPMVERPSATSMTVWARTSKPSPFMIRFGTEPSKLDQSVEAVATKLADDNTGFVTLSDLKPSTSYWYEVHVEGFSQGQVVAFFFAFLNGGFAAAEARCAPGARTAVFRSKGLPGRTGRELPPSASDRRSCRPETQAFFSDSNTDGGIPSGRPTTEYWS